MSHALSRTVAEFEELFPEAAILLRMTLQSMIDTYRVDSGASEVEELRAQVEELKQKLSRPKAVGKGKNIPLNVPPTDTNKAKPSGRIKL